MKVKRCMVCLVAVLLMLVLCVNAFAALQINPVTLSLSFNNTTATCKATIVGSGNINATMELWQGGNLISSWTKTGTSVVRFDESFTVQSGLMYTLTVSGTIGNTAINATPVSKACP